MKKETAAEKFQRGIIDFDVDCVREALDAGARPDTLVAGYHPLAALLYADILPEKSTYWESDIDKRRSAIVNLLLSRGARLTERNAYVSKHCKYLVDHLLFSNHVNDVADIVVHAIRESLAETGKPYRIDVQAFLAFCASHNDIDMGRAKECLGRLHRAVAGKLENPQTKIEKELTSKHGGALEFWRQPLDFSGATSAFNGATNDNVSAPQREQDQANKSEVAEGMKRFISILPKKTSQEVRTELNELIGMNEEDGVKDQAWNLVLSVLADREKKNRGEKTEKKSLNTILTGNPGTGKTTVSEIMAKLMHALDLAGGRYVKISRENLVAGYLGQTEEKVVSLIENADFIFIDEAYNLVADDTDKRDFGHRVIDALMNALEDKRKDLVVFFAGYPEEMEKFLDSNPGLRSRIACNWHMPDYTMEELGLILDQMLEKKGCKIEPDARALFLRELEKAKALIGERKFGNARDVRNLAEKLPDKINHRLTKGIRDEEAAKEALARCSTEQLTTVTKEDVEALNIVRTLCPASVLKSSPAKKDFGFRPPG